MAVNFIADGMSAVTPYLYIDGAAKAVEFYKTVFGAKERNRMEGKGGTLMHAELEISGAVIMMGEADPGMDMKSPKDIGGSAGGVFIYVRDADAVMDAAVKAGAKQIVPVESMFWGDRMGRIVDAWGHHWTIGTHVEDVSHTEMEKRQNEWLAKNS